MDDEPTRCDLVSRAQALLGSDQLILSAEIFGLKDTFATEAFASLAGAQTGTLLVTRPESSPSGKAVAVHATRHAAAERRGLSLRMLVVVTPAEIHILDWSADSGPTRILMSFDRATTEVAVHRLGLHRRVTLHDRTTGRVIPLIGTRGRRGAAAHGGRSVLAALGASG